MLVQNGISSCLLVKSSAQTGTQAAATAIPPWWVLGLPSGGRHKTSIGCSGKAVENAFSLSIELLLVGNLL